MTRPSAQVLLKILAGAGDEGKVTSALVRVFDEPDNLQRRNARVNQILARLARTGQVRRSGRREASPFSQRARSWRWYIGPGVPLDSLWPPGTRTPIQSQAINALTRAGVKTLGELRDLPEYELRDLRNVGAATMWEIFRISGCSDRQVASGLAASQNAARAERREASWPRGPSMDLAALSAGDRQELERMAGIPGRHNKRVRAVLARAGGLDDKDAASALQCSPGSVRYWCRLFTLGGADALGPVAESAIRMHGTSLTARRNEPFRR
jgi:hypothetical protein